MRELHCDHQRIQGDSVVTPNAEGQVIDARIAGGNTPEAPFSQATEQAPSNNTNAEVSYD